jgi:hypothetical protein
MSVGGASLLVNIHWAGGKACHTMEGWRSN